MRFSTAPAAIAGLLAVALLPAATAKPLALVEEPVDVQNELVVDKRQQCPESQICGWERKLCCPSGCDTNSEGQAVCKAQAAGAATTGWVFTTALITQTGIITQTSVFSTFIGGPAPTAAACNDASPCGQGFWCASGTCQPIAGNTPGATPGVTATGSPTTTLPFGTPIPTGANGTLVESNSGGGGLSGGAIAGIVIGVILGIILLLLICFYCCARSAFHGLMAIFGLGKKRRTREETTYISEHHHSGSAAAGGGRWYGQASSRPSRPPKKSGGGMGNLLGIGAGLAGLAAVLGMKRRHDRRHDDKSTTVSGSSYYYSDYTSSSSASSDDRRTRNTRHSSRR